MVGLHRVVQRVDIDDRPARRVDDDDALLRRSQRFRVDEITCLIVERCVDAHNVALRHQLMQAVCPADANGVLITVGLIRVEAHNVHIESFGTPRGGCSDPPHANNAKCAVTHALTVRVQCRAPVANRVGAQILIVKRYALGERHHQRDGMVRNFARAVVRGVTDGDTHFCPGFDIDIVKANGGLDENPALFRFGPVFRWNVGPDNAVTIGPLLVCDVVEALTELTRYTFAQCLGFNFVTTTPCAREQYPYAHGCP